MINKNTKNNPGDFLQSGESPCGTGNQSCDEPYQKKMKSITTLIKAGALLAVIAGFGFATASASDACNSCCKTSCSSCAKCTDGKCSTCCK